LSLPEPNRETPYHTAHSTTVAGLKTIKGGDDRFYNNLFVGKGQSSAEDTYQKDPAWAGGYGLWVYNFRELPVKTGGNCYYNGARPYANEAAPAQPLELIRTRNSSTRPAATSWKSSSGRN